MTEAPAPADTGQPALRPDTIGLKSSVIIGVAGSAPGQCLAIALVPLLTSSAYGIVPAFVVATAAMLCIAVAFNRLNLWKQDAGGPYKWVGRAVHPYAGYMVGWLLLATFAITVLVDILTIGPAVLALLGANTSSRLGTALSAMLLGIPVVAIAAIGIRPTARLQNALAVGEYLIILGFAVLAAVAIFVTHKTGTSTPTLDFLKAHGSGTGSFTGGILLAIFWIAEWDAGIYEAEETTRRERNPGLAAIIAVALLGVFYTVISVVFSSAVPRSEMAKNGANAIVFVADRLAGTGWGRIMAVAVLSSVLATLLASLTVSSRIAMSMARDQGLPRVFARISATYRTPVAGTLIIGLVALAMVWPYVFMSSVSGALDKLINTSSVAFVIYYAATGLTVVWLYRGRVFSSTKNMLLSGVLPLVSAGFLVWVAYRTMRAAPAAQNWTLCGITALGLLLMLFARHVRKAPSLSSRPERASLSGVAASVGLLAGGTQNPRRAPRSSR
jgi:amino acid transporter